MTQDWSDAECRLWWAQPADVETAHGALLNEVEQRRASAYRREIDSNRFIAGCVLSRLVLGQALRLPAGQVPLRRDCASCGEPHGPPRTVEGWWLSISHAGSWIVVAVTRLGPVGVDVERRDPASREAITSILTSEESAAVAAVEESALPHALTRMWTRKEAAVKATGQGLRDITAVEVSGPFHQAAVLRYAAIEEPMRLCDIAVDEQHTAAVAITTGTTPVITQHDGGRLLREWLNRSPAQQPR